jgi:uncharacterized membrane protein
MAIKHKTKQPGSSLHAWFRKSFVTGVAVIMPVLATLWLFAWAFFKITDAGFDWMTDKAIFLWITNSGLTKAMGRLFVLMVVIGIITFVGVFARNYFGRLILGFSEKIFKNIPIVGRIYIALRQLSSAFWGENKTIFREVIMVEYPRRGLYTLGFVTSECSGEIDEKLSGKLLNVFIPTTPNPTSGYFLMVPEKKVVHLAMSVEDGMKMIISGGAVTPEEGLKSALDDDSSAPSEALGAIEKVDDSIDNDLRGQS